MLNGSALLLVEDNPGDARLLREMFAEDGPHEMQLTQVGSMREAEDLLRERVIDIILLDLGLPDTEGLGAVQRAHAAAPRIPLVVLTGLDDESMALLALKEGAQDYLVKGRIEARGLLRALRYAVERKTMEEALFVEKERAQVTLNCIGDAVICTDSSGGVTFLNVVAEQLTGWLRRDAEGQNVSDVFQVSGAGTELAALLPVADPAELPSNVQMPSSCVLLRRDGTQFPIEGSVAPIHDRAGRPTGAVVVFRDVSAARAASREITYSAQHDFLTGLPNRLLLNDRITQAIVLARRHSKQTATLFLDLDGFKHINDSLGHSIGDRLLQSIAGRLVDCARASDTVSRQGGDEFIVLLSDMQQPEDAAIAARRILNAISAPHSIDHHDLHVTASIGVSVYPDDGKDAETLIKNADTAMYQAKENGRQSYQFFTPAMNARAVERQSIEQNLRRALERNEFALHYQPKIDFRTGAITGAEALLRWTHPTRGSVSPAEFIPVAEDCGLILPIGNWVLQQACRQAQAWVAAGLPVATMAVNVSAKEFRDPSFLEGLFAILEETGLDPRSLELELTESVLMKNAESAATVLRVLREKGVQVAVDDFGTGYSSLSYLRKFPVDALKIDQSFVGQITATGGDDSIVSAVISMARSLKLRVVAEGVETLEQLAFLRSHQCDEAQGYYFSRPVPPEQFAKLLWTGIPLAFEGCRSGTPYRVPARGRPSPRVAARGRRSARGRREQAVTMRAPAATERRDPVSPTFLPDEREAPRRGPPFPREVNHQLGIAALKAEGVDRFFAISPGLMAIAGFDGYFKMLNPAWEETLGYSIDDLCSRPYLELVHPDDRMKATDEAAQELRGGQTIYRFKNRYRCKDGSYRWLAWSATPSLAQGLIYGSARDVTESVRMQQALRASNDGLEQVIATRELLLHEATVKNETLGALGRFKDEAAAMIVHDIKSPLAVILANYDYILGGFEGADDFREALQDSQAAGRRMLRLLANLLDVARLKDGRLDVHPTMIDLAQMFGALIEQRPLLAGGRTIVLVPGQAVPVTMDADLLTRAVENILDTAARLMRGDGRIEIELRELGPEIEIRIGMGGAPIPVEARRAIFDRPFRSEDDVERTNLGLGLYFCRLAIDAQGGRIWIEEGDMPVTVFIIRLPRLVSPVPPPPTEAAAS